MRQDEIHVGLFVKYTPEKGKSKMVIIKNDARMIASGEVVCNIDVVEEPVNIELLSLPE